MEKFLPGGRKDNDGEAAAASAVVLPPPGLQQQQQRPLPTADGSEGVVEATENSRAAAVADRGGVPPVCRFRHSAGDDLRPPHVVCVSSSRF